MTDIDKLGKEVVEAAKQWYAGPRSSGLLRLRRAVSTLIYAESEQFPNSISDDDIAGHVEDTPTPQDEREELPLRAAEITDRHEVWRPNSVGAGSFRAVLATERLTNNADHSVKIVTDRDDPYFGAMFCHPDDRHVVRDKPPTPKTALERVSDTIDRHLDDLLATENAGALTNAGHCALRRVQSIRCEVDDILKEHEG